MIDARKLVASDAKALKQIRLETLAHYGELFARSYEVEQSRPLSYWQELATETTGRCFFGLFDSEQMIGVNAGRVWEENPTLALGWGSFVKLDYRGKGYSKKIWEEREKWISDKKLKGIVFYMLENNVRGVDILEKRGAVYMFNRALSFDGGPETMFKWYKAPANSNPVRNAATLIKITGHEVSKAL